ncbi:hypothetical protein [Cellulosimicrobium sp. Marseille-Q4280]|uniref:hypothetical protein n=1 Tax=Cellulosimicrobium sp. Marseille-Q4280 TaxID=2937992 RepID=UPI00203E1685|nr:hypothetical protein [Cellulosimicrobium sp. Marseille-Q4280]
MSPQEVRRRVAAREEERLTDAVAWACYEAMREAPEDQRPQILHAFAEFSRGAQGLLEAISAPDA